MSIKLLNIVFIMMACLVLLSQALPVFDAELVASPLLHDTRINNYRGVRRSIFKPSKEDSSQVRV